MKLELGRYYITCISDADNYNETNVTVNLNNPMNSIYLKNDLSGLYALTKLHLKPTSVINLNPERMYYSDRIYDVTDHKDEIKDLASWLLLAHKLPYITKEDIKEVIKCRKT